MTKSAENFPVREPAVQQVHEPLAGEPGPFRSNAAALILRRGEAAVEILLGERHDTPGAWQWPQGGIDPGEDPLRCVHREVLEETGISRIEVLYRFPFLLRYRFPAALTARFAPNQGQEQHYFIVRALEEPDPQKVLTPEFRELRWLPLGTAVRNAVWFKEAVYREAVHHALSVVHELPL